MSKIYVASSWRNNYQQDVVRALRGAGHEVYDFKNPRPNDYGFQWSEIDPDWQDWNTIEYFECLKHPIADSGFASDMNALSECDVCVLVLPSGRSAHIEAGFAAGAGKKLIVMIPEKIEPELMYKMTDHWVQSINDLLLEVA